MVEFVPQAKDEVDYFFIHVFEEKNIDQIYLDQRKGLRNPDAISRSGPALYCSGLN